MLYINLCIKRNQIQPNVKYREVLEHTGMKTSQYLSSVVGGWIIVFNATFNNISVISWWLVLLLEETGVPGENH
jgi:hypothetical protein